MKYNINICHQHNINICRLIRELGNVAMRDTVIMKVDGPLCKVGNVKSCNATFLYFCFADKEYILIVIQQPDNKA